jgi:lysophospholipase
LAVTNFLVNDFDFTADRATSNIPNPFCGFGSGTQSKCDTYGNTLYLGDGGSDDQNIPLVPLLQPARQLDVIIAVDNSDDSGNAFDTDCGYNWPQAVSLQSTLAYAKSTKGQSQKIAFPATLPSQTQIQQNPTYVYTPTFFGCNASDSTAPGQPPVLIVYLPNAPYTAFSNASTASTLDFEFGSVLPVLLENGNNVASSGIPRSRSNPIPAWGTCLACAVAERSRQRLGIAQTSVCTSCFNAYCWESKKPVLPPIAGNPACGGVVTNWYNPSALLTMNPAQGVKKYDLWTWAWLCEACRNHCTISGCTDVCDVVCAITGSKMARRIRGL